MNYTLLYHTHIFLRSPCRMFSKVCPRSHVPGCFQYIGVCQVYIVTIYDRIEPMKYCLL